MNSMHHLHAPNRGPKQQEEKGRASKKGEGGEDFSNERSIID